MIEIGAKDTCTLAMDLKPFVIIKHVFLGQLHKVRVVRTVAIAGPTRMLGGQQLHVADDVGQISTNCSLAHPFPFVLVNCLEVFPAVFCMRNWCVPTKVTKGTDKVGDSFILPGCGVCFMQRWQIHGLSKHVGKSNGTLVPLQGGISFAGTRYQFHILWLFLWLLFLCRCCRLFRRRHHCSR